MLRGEGWGPLPPQEVLEYVARLTDRLLAASNGHILAVYLHGSAALGGWQATVSDMDVLVIVADHVGAEPAGVLATAAARTVSACPGTGLEMSVVSQAEAAAARPPWRFLAHLAAPHRGQPKVVLGETHAGDPDLLLHFAACRAAAWTVLGPPAVDMIGSVPRPALLEALARELSWGLGQASAPYALLNACRAELYLQEGRFVAKGTGGRWAVDHDVGPRDSIACALAAQAGAEPPGTLTAVDIQFVQETATRLAAAARSG